MATIDKSAQRAIGVIALLGVAALALRGYLPGSETVADPEPPSNNPLALVADIVLLTAAVAIIGFAIIARLRDPRMRPAARAELPASSNGLTGRPTWRFTLLALGLIIGWLVLVLLLMRLNIMGPGDQPAPVPAPDPSQAPTSPPDVAETPPPPSTPPEPGTNVIGYLVPPMLILMVLIVVGTAIVSRRQRRGAKPYPLDADVDETSTGEPAAESLARAAELGLAEIADLSREPREAIIACYAAMERELTRVPGAVPQDCDTPTEVLARAVEHHALGAESATQLVELFEEARFSPHVMDEGHRDVAVGVLRLVLSELRSVA
ncbi:DUF4129 domain-containing protein [Mycobacterium sp.]|uniref:DUF4129 domain-containing protein n=1 Tax=Mycobacterium sp. TaxID=1785 RepID=UPI002DA2003F|nr:DUF4129 domain-containing protein [Mycobacterium sp.]